MLHPVICQRHLKFGLILLGDIYECRWRPPTKSRLNSHILYAFDLRKNELPARFAQMRVWANPTTTPEYKAAVVRRDVKQLALKYACPTNLRTAPNIKEFESSVILSLQP